MQDRVTSNTRMDRCLGGLDITELYLRLLDVKEYPHAENDLSIFKGKQRNQFISERIWKGLS